MAKKRLPRTGVLRIRWRDAYTSAGWVTAEDYESEDAIPETVGWIVPDLKPGYVSLAGTVLHHSGVWHFNDISHIPSDMVVSWETID